MVGRNALYRDFKFMNLAIGIDIELEHILQIEEEYKKGECNGIIVCFHCSLEDNDNEDNDDDDVYMNGNNLYPSVDKKIRRDGAFHPVKGIKFQQSKWYSAYHYCASLQGNARTINKYRDNTHTHKKTFSHFILSDGTCNYKDGYFQESHPRPYNFQSNHIGSIQVTACGYLLLKVKK